MQIEAGKILSEHLKKCYDIHGVQIPDKYIPYINSAIRDIVCDALQEAAKNAEVVEIRNNPDFDPYAVKSYSAVSKQSITSTINKLKF